MQDSNFIYVKTEIIQTCVKQEGSHLEEVLGRSNLFFNFFECLSF